VGKKEHFYTVGGNVIGTTTMESSMEVPPQIKNKPTINPAIPLLGIYLKECKPRYTRAMYTPIIIATLYTIGKKYKQLKCLTTDEWIKKMCYIYTME
jgi:hypothetical protein